METEAVLIALEGSLNRPVRNMSLAGDIENGEMDG